MTLRFPVCAQAGLIAAALWGISALIFFGIPHGFEEQIGGAYILLPGILIGALVSDAVSRTHPALAMCTFWGLTVGTSAVCYFGISFACVKVYRLARSLKSNRTAT